MDGILLTKRELDEICSRGERALNKRLRRVLYEEKGISNEVKRIVGEVVNNILAAQKEIFNTTEYKTTAKLNEKNIHYTFSVYKFNDTAEEKEFLNTVQSDSTSLFRAEADMMYIFTTILFVGGKIDLEELYDSLYHETSHIFEQKRAGKSYPNPQLYAYVATMLNSGDLYERVLAEILYLCNTTEQNSYRNGLYGAIMSKLRKGDFPIKKMELQAFQKLDKLYNNYNFLVSNKANEQLMHALKPYKEKFGWTYHKFKKRCESGIYDFEKKINATLEKCQKDAFDLGYFVNGNQDWLFKMD